MNSPILVTGASGQLGRLVIQHLLAQRSGPIIATTRTPEHLHHIVNEGVDVRIADFSDPPTLAAAFSGAKRLLLISTNTFAPPGRRVLEHRHAIEAARLAGVEHIVYSSFITIGDHLALLTSDHRATEDLIEHSGLGYTILRNSFYSDLALRTLANARSTGEFYTAAGEGHIAYVTRDDCARAAAAAVAGQFNGNRILNITGPAAIDARELARIAGIAMGRNITAILVTPEELQEHLVEAGAHPQMAGILAAIDRGVSLGAMDIETTSFESLTGRPPTTLAEFLARAHPVAS